MMVDDTVAPRTGGRGLKFVMAVTVTLFKGRPPHRGAWIEIFLTKSKN